MSEAVFGLKQCPECGSEKLIPVSVKEETNFFCEDCVRCWHVERDRVNVVDPQTCPGCQLGVTACFERWETSSKRPKGGVLDDETSRGPGSRDPVDGTGHSGHPFPIGGQAPSVHSPLLRSLSKPLGNPASSPGEE